MKDGKILGSNTVGVNQILPHVHKWAYELFLVGQKNNWVPTEIPMAKDIEQWNNNTLSEDEKLLVKRCLGFFAGSESLVANNLLLRIFKDVTDPECRQYIGRQNYEEGLHNQTIIYICDSLRMNISEVYEAYKTIPSIKAKDDFLMDITSNTNPIFENPQIQYYEILFKQEALRNIITYYIICEGIFFYSGFAMLLNFGRQNKLPGISEQIHYTLRDEANHIKFGTELIKTIIIQELGVWNTDFIDATIKHIKKAVDLEIAYAYDVLPRGILGLNAEMFVDYVKYIANRRLEGIGLEPLWPTARNPFEWMTEAIDITKQKNFFETKVIDYQSGALLDDF